MMYRVTGTVMLEVVTYVEAKSKKEAEKILDEGDREVMICVHGSEFNGQQSEVEWVLVDGQADAPYRYEIEDY